MVPASSAGAGEFRIGFLDPLFGDPEPETRALWLDRAQDSRSQLIRLTVGWAFVAGSNPPTDPTSPSDPSYNFAAIDRAVRDAAARGLRVMLTIGHAPTWAEGSGRPGLDVAPPGSWKPDPHAYGEFATAVASRYSGTFDPPGAQAVLPRVGYFQALNEPNLATYLTPQWKRRRPASPSHYKRLLNAFYPSVKAVNPSNVVISAGTAPYGSRPGGRSVRPLRFWQSILCLARKRGKLRSRRCRNPARADVVAHHPITGRPRSRAAHRGDATIPELRKIRRMVRKAERARNVLPAGRRPLWVTELWWETDPPDRFATVSLRQQARWIAESFYLIWKQGIRTTILFLIRDQPVIRGNPFATYQTGVYRASGKPKPSLRAVRFPFVTERRSSRKLTAWGKAPRTGPVVIQVKRRGKWHGLRGVRGRAGKVFKTTVRVRGRATLRARVGGTKSLAWRQRR